MPLCSAFLTHLAYQPMISIIGCTCKDSTGKRVTHWPGGQFWDWTGGGFLGGEGFVSSVGGGFDEGLRGAGVEFSQPVGLFEFIRLKQALEQILEREVDLVTPDALRESMRAEILEQAVDVTP